MNCFHCGFFFYGTIDPENSVHQNQVANFSDSCEIINLRIYTNILGTKLQYFILFFSLLRLSLITQQQYNSECTVVGCRNDYLICRFDRFFSFVLLEFTHTAPHNQHHTNYARFFFISSDEMGIIVSFQNPLREMIMCCSVYRG